MNIFSDYNSQQIEFVGSILFLCCPSICMSIAFWFLSGNKKNINIFLVEKASNLD